MKTTKDPDNPGPEKEISNSGLHNKFSFVILAVFVVLVISTFFASRITQDLVQDEIRKEFYLEVAEIKNWFQEKLNIYILAIEGLHGFVQASDFVRTDEWSTYIKRVKLIEKYPGISSAAYVERVTNKNKQAFIDEVRSSQGIPGFNIYPDTQKEEYLVVKYIEPLEGREKALGFDISSEEKRLKVLQKATDEGGIVSTGRINLITTGKPGFALLTPVYTTNQPLESSQERRQNLKGFIYAVFRGEDMFKSALPKDNPFPGLDFEIYDAEEISKDSLLYDHDPSQEISKLSDNQLKTKETLEINGQTWDLYVATTPKFGLTASQDLLPKIVLVSGLLLSLVILIVFVSTLPLKRHS